MGGHSIPIDSGVIESLHILGFVNDKDYKAGNATGMERASAKSKGIEFGSLLHQLGADFTANPYSPAVREILLAINPGCKDDLPKRRSKKRASPEAVEPIRSGKKKQPEIGKKKTTEKKKPATEKKTSAAKAKTVKKKSPPSKKTSTKKKKAKSSATKTPAKTPAQSKTKSASSKLSKRKPR